MADCFLTGAETDPVSFYPNLVITPAADKYQVFSDPSFRTPPK